MTKQEAKKEVRRLVKKSVLTYLKETTDLNWEMYGLSIIKKEICHAYKRYWVYWNSLSQQWAVMTYGNEIISE